MKCYNCNNKIRMKNILYCPFCGDCLEQEFNLSKKIIKARHCGHYDDVIQDLDIEQLVDKIRKLFAEKGTWKKDEFETKSMRLSYYVNHIESKINKLFGDRFK